MVHTFSSPLCTEGFLVNACRRTTSGLGLLFLFENSHLDLPVQTDQPVVKPSVLDI